MTAARTIIHVDMDAFYAAVEARDNPSLRGKPLIIGALPGERGVVATCSYECRMHGVHSAMSIKEAQRLCPHAIFMRPSIEKYRNVSAEIHRIWNDYTDIVEYVSLDEGYLDVTHSAQLFGGAQAAALEIKRRIKDETGLNCSVGLGYSMMSAKLASEEKKPDGFFEIPDASFLRKLISGRNVRTVFGVGEKTAEKLQAAGIKTVGDIYSNEVAVLYLLGNHGKEIIDLAKGIDGREVVAHYNYEAKSLGKETTFQKDTTDFEYLKDVLTLFAKELSLSVRLDGIFFRTVTLKVTYSDMKQITRAKSTCATNKAGDIFYLASSLLDGTEKRPVRLIGITLSNFSKGEPTQLTLFDDIQAQKRAQKLQDTLLKIERKFGGDIVKTGAELKAEKHIAEHDKND